jgi:ATP-dependent DNA helicase RecG
MSIERVKKLLKHKEGIRLEFKESRTDLPGNLFETICSMLNREGGDILLGVANDGTIKGIDPARIDIIKNNLITLSNNPNKLDPPFILFPEVYEVKGSYIIHLQVPESSQLHRSASVVYDRSSDGDFKVTQPQLIAEIFNRKRTHYTEGIVYGGLRFEDFKPEIFSKVRNLIRSNNPSHPWLSVDDETMLKMAGLWKRDLYTHQEGYTLAAALLFGKDEVIQSVLPHYKIDALVRKVNMLRYDDREYILTNLIDAYDLLMNFVSKHLPDKFYMEGDQRVSLRSKIFREVTANLIVHREYTNAHPATFIIYKDRVETENANNPHGEGPINPDNFAPFPKNPAIAKFFMQLGRVEELGSGVLNVNRFIKEYAVTNSPQFIEGPIFKMVIPISEGVTVIDEGLNEGLNEGLKSLLEAIRSNPGIKAKDLVTLLENRPIKTIERQIKDLVIKKYIERRGSKKTGGYYLTEGFTQKNITD